MELPSHAHFLGCASFTNDNRRSFDEAAGSKIRRKRYPDLYFLAQSCDLRTVG
jgi:hypothetical protein